jgi:hypothetical protein
MNKTDRSELAAPAVGSLLDREVRPQRLWIVRVVHEAYVLAADEEQAKQARAEIERWEDFPKVTAEPWAGRHIEGWDDGCGVYGTRQTLSLKTAKKVDLAA